MSAESKQETSSQESSDQILSSTPRYDVSIFDTPFAQLPDPKRVWLGPPNSRIEGLGRLNILTPQVVAEAAASEIKTGQRVGLGWSLTKLEYSQFKRQKFEHRVIPLTTLGGFGAAFDDAYAFNPQQSSQWDGFRHHSQAVLTTQSLRSQDRVYYGGTRKEEILNPASARIGLSYWAEEGIAGRGILIDYARWAANQNPPVEYSTFSTHTFPLSVLKQVLQETGTVPKKGDILFIRTGVIEEWNGWSEDQKRAYAAQGRPSHAGLEPSIELLEWLWDSGFSAVVGDAISWEVYPCQGDISLHEYLLAGWGMPIGELFDLDALSKLCSELNRYSFFVTSMPLNVPGGVSSPPNALAIF